jgi:hypothetical protein
VSDGAFDLLQAQRAVFRSSIRAPEKLVALALLDHWSRGTETFPSVQRLAAWSSLDRTAVMRALQGLERQGAIVVKRQKGVPNRYALGQLSLLPVAESDRSPAASGTEPVAESDGSETGVTPEPVVESDQSPRATRRAERLPPVAESDLTSRSERHEGTQEVTQGRNPDTGPRKTSKARTTWRRVPEAWQPNDAQRKLATELGVNVELELAKFRDHEFAKPKTDADAAFRTWLRNAHGYAARGNRRNGPALVQRGGIFQPGDESWLEEGTG